jgi:hypothetical protein
MPAAQRPASSPRSGLEHSFSCADLAADACGSLIAGQPERSAPRSPRADVLSRFFSSQPAAPDWACLDVAGQLNANASSGARQISGPCLAPMQTARVLLNAEAHSAKRSHRQPLQPVWAQVQLPVRTPHRPSSRPTVAALRGTKGVEMVRCGLPGAEVHQPEADENLQQAANRIHMGSQRAAAAERARARSSFAQAPRLKSRGARLAGMAAWHDGPPMDASSHVLAAHTSAANTLAPTGAVWRIKSRSKRSPSHGGPRAGSTSGGSVALLSRTTRPRAHPKQRDVTSLMAAGRPELQCNMSMFRVLGQSQK